MDELPDQYLRQLIEAVQRTEKGTPARQRALSQLLAVFWPIAEGLLLKHRKSRGLLSRQHDDAMQEILDHSIRQLGERIDEFSMDKAEGAHGSVKWALMHWFDGVCRLKYALLDYCATHAQKPIQSLDAPLGDGDLTLLDTLEDRNGDGIPRLSGLERMIEKLQSRSDRAVAHAINHILAEDPPLQENPQQCLSHCHPKNRPDCNCQAIFQLQKQHKRLTAVSQALGINHQTLNSHYRRHCIPLMQALVRQRLGYDPMSELPPAQRQPEPI